MAAHEENGEKNKSKEEFSISIMSLLLCLRQAFKTVGKQGRKHSLNITKPRHF